MGTDHSHIATINRPAPFRLVLLALIPPFFGLLLFGISGAVFETTGLSASMKFLCAMDVAFFSCFVFAWLSVVLLPPASPRIPQWFRGSAPSPAAGAASAVSAEYMLTLAAAVTWPILILAFPSFEFSLASLFGDSMLLGLAASFVDKLGVSALSEVVLAEQYRFAALSKNISALSNVVGLFVPGLLYATATLYMATLFLVTIRRYFIAP